MARWSDMMRTPSYKGVEFPMTSCAVRGGRTLAVHTYPDVPGQEVEDQGRQARSFTITATFSPDMAWQWGDDIYPARLNKLLEAIDAKGSGTFVHPLWGEFECAVSSWSIDDAGNRPDQSEVSFTLIEDSLDDFTLSNSTTLNRQSQAQQRADDIDLFLQQQGETTGTPFSDFLAMVTASIYLARSTRYYVESTFKRVLADMREFIAASTAMQDAVNFPYMELVILLQNDMGALVSSSVRDYPRFAYYTTTGEMDIMTLSLQLYGDTSKWEELLSVNTGTIKNPQRIPGGTEIAYYYTD